MNLDDLGTLDDDLFDDSSSTSNDGQVDTNDVTRTSVNTWTNNSDNDDDTADDDSDQDDALTEFLRYKGIDASSIKFQNDKGETEEVAFKDLSKEEQLELLSYNPAQTDLDLQADESRFLYTLRQNNMSVQDYLNAYANSAIKNYLDNQPVQETFDVDSYSDDELFLANLKDTIPDLTEEEALQQLELEKQNPTLFDRKVAGLRQNYKDREEQWRSQQLEDARAAQEQQAAQFEQVIVDAIQTNRSVDFGDVSIDMSTDDMNEVASFILDSDPAGVRYIAKALNDPRTLVNMAWFALKGQEAMRQTAEYYKKKITEVGKAKYEQGLKDGKAGKRSVVARSTSKNNQTNVKSIDDLD